MNFEEKKKAVLEYTGHTIIESLNKDKVKYKCGNCGERE